MALHHWRALFGQCRCRYLKFSLAGGRKDARQHAKKLASMQVLAFPWLCLKKPVKAPAWLRLGLKLLAWHWSAVRMLEPLSFDGNTPNSVDACDMGRAAGKVVRFEKCLPTLSRAVASLLLCRADYFGCGRSFGDPVLDAPSKRCGVVVGEVDLGRDITAKPLVADRLSFLGFHSLYPECSWTHTIDNGPNRWCYALASASALAGIYLEPSLQGSQFADEAKFVFGKSLVWPS